MKVCIIGALIAAKLSQNDKVEVSVVARGDNLRAIRADGIRLDSPNGSLVAKVAATDARQDLGVQDYLILTLKSCWDVSPASRPRLDAIR